MLASLTPQERTAFSAPYTLDPTADPLDNAFHLARAARCAYAGDFFNLSPSGERNFPEVAPLLDAFPYVNRFAQQHVQGFVAADDTDAVLAFKGTERAGEWMEFIGDGRHNAMGGRVHRGIFEVVERALPEVLARFYDAHVLEKNLWMAGHSLGGAFAELAARLLHDLGFSPTLACTFGAPPIYDRRAAEEFKPPLLRFVNSDDIVPNLSWPHFFDRYHHVGQEIRLMPSGRIAEPRHTEHLAARLDRYEHLGQPLPQTGPVKDHLMAEYVRRLALIQGQTTKS